MDNYPADLAPEFDERGAVTTPFEEWWARVQPSFPGVPENVARQWLHRHWRHSPFAWLRSSAYRFSRISWPGERLKEIASRANDWDYAKTLKRGSQLMTMCDFWLVRYATEHDDIPEPIIVLDNRDDHLRADGCAPVDWNYPASFILVEGHTRLEIAAYLYAQGRLRSIDVWLMERGAD